MYQGYATGATLLTATRVPGYSLRSLWRGSAQPNWDDRRALNRAKASCTVARTRLTRRLG